MANRVTCSFQKIRTNLLLLWSLMVCLYRSSLNSFDVGLHQASKSSGKLGRLFSEAGMGTFEIGENRSTGSILQLRACVCVPFFGLFWRETEAKPAIVG